jgi:hypothetical protein
MRMNCQSDLLGVRTHLDRKRCLGNEVACVGPDDRAADNPVVFEQHLGDPLVATEGQRASARRPGKYPFPYFMPRALASFSVNPTHTTSGSV